MKSGIVINEIEQEDPWFAPQVRQNVSLNSWKIFCLDALLNRANSPSTIIPGVDLIQLLNVDFFMAMQKILQMFIKGLAYKIMSKFTPK